MGQRIRTFTIRIQTGQRIRTFTILIRIQTGKRFCIFPIRIRIQAGRPKLSTRKGKTVKNFTTEGFSGFSWSLDVLWRGLIRHIRRFWWKVFFVVKTLVSSGSRLSTKFPASRSWFSESGSERSVCTKLLYWLIDSPLAGLRDSGGFQRLLLAWKRNSYVMDSQVPRQIFFTVYGIP